MTEQEKKEKMSDDEQDKLSDEELKDVAGGVLPPSGDSNPSDRFNRTVDTDQIIDPNNPNAL